MPLQATLAKVGFGKQTVKGTAVTTVESACGIISGAPLLTDIQQELENRTSGTRMALGVNRTQAMVGMDFAMRAHPITVGSVLMGLLGVDTYATGTHTFTLGATQQYLTAYANLAGTDVTIKDFVVDEVTFSWDANNPVEVAVKGMGVDFASFTAPTITADETVQSKYLSPIGGTFQLAVTGAAATAKITGGSITIKNNLQPVILAGAITPDDFMAGEFAIECSFDLTPNNLNEWRTFTTGTTSGTSLRNYPPIGAFNVVFKDDVTNGGVNATTLTLAHSNVAFTTDFPDADPNGGSVTISLAGVAYTNSNSSTGLTCTLAGGKASAY